jgi:imidazolonepropionase-like amidohydrolase
MEQETRTPAFMNARRAEFAGLGVLALRDMGAASDHVNTLGDEPGLPRVHAAGMVVVPYGGFPFTPTAPAVLTRAFLERLEQGATWIKVFADWSNDWGGQMHTGFSERDEVTYPLAVLAEAVQAAHRAGGLVAAHCFTTAGAEVAIRAGVDSLEHGWGVDAAMVDEMAARGIAWIPLVGIAATMRRDAVRERDHDRIAWVESSLARMAQTLPYAQARGVRILAGTDWFPALTVIDEIRALVGLGIDPASAVGAGAWAARHWLGEPGIAEGAPADLVLYRSDPRSDLAALEAPALILSGGRSVPVAPPRQQRPPASWTAQAGT